MPARKPPTRATPAPRVKTDHQRQASIALGIFFISVIMFLETWVADHRLPNPKSPFVWSVLGTVAVLALGRFVWCRIKAKNARE